MKALKISKQISLPIDAVTQTMAMIGRKGAGKTYLATMIAEQMLDNKAQVVIIDPVGVWWGLRVDADGKRKGKEIFAIGGDHGDIPIIPEAGRKIAKLLVEKQISVVLDVSGFRIGDFKRFAADFAEEFFHLKKSHRSPVHVFVEEAQKLIPQRVGMDEARMVGAFEQIVRLGRNYGIGCSLVTQRPQSVNKEVLSQVECLCVLQVTGPHERKALEEWVYEVGADRKLIGELPGLARGEGYVWSPSWLRLFERVTFSKKQTFDASATPEVGKKTQAASISAVDVKELREQMAEVVEQAEKDNPVALRRKIAELEKQGKGQKVVHDMTVPTRMIEEAVRKEASKWKGSLELANKEIARLSKIVQQVARLTGSDVNVGAAPVRIELPKDIRIGIDTGRGRDKAVAGVMEKKPDGRMEVLSSYEDDGKLSKGARLILTYLSQASGGKSKSQLWIATGYAPGGGFNNYVYELTGKQLITEERGLYSVTSNVTEDMIDRDFQPGYENSSSKLALGARKIFNLLMEDTDRAMTKNELAEATGYALGGGFNNYVYELTGREMIVKVSEGYQINPKLLTL